MTYINSAARPEAPGVLRRVLRAIGNGLEFWANLGPMAEAVRQLNALSDADLAARGTTRHAEVQRIFGPRGQI